MKDESKNNGGKKHISLNVYLGHSETFCRVFYSVMNYVGKLQFVCLIGGRVFNPRQQQVLSIYL